MAVLANATNLKIVQYKLPPLDGATLNATSSFTTLNSGEKFFISEITFISTVIGAWTIQPNVSLGFNAPTYDNFIPSLSIANTAADQNYNTDNLFGPLVPPNTTFVIIVNSPADAAFTLVPIITGTYYS